VRALSRGKSERKRAGAEQAAEEREAAMRQQLKQQITGIQEDFLEKHSQRLMELVAQRQE
jgi:hypothetical protein